MAKQFTAVLAGCGGMSRGWLNADAVKNKVEIVGLVDIKKTAAVQRAKDFGLTDAIVATDLSVVLDKTKPDVVFDVSAPEAHCAVTLTALRQGCNVLGEKPLSDTMTNARRMVGASRKYKKLYAVMQNRRFAKPIRALRKFLDSGAIGEVTTVQSDFFTGPHFGAKDFRARMKHVLLMDMAIHTFDAARLITGADATSVYAEEWNPEGSWYEHGASATAIFDMTNGIKYIYNGSWCAEGCNTSWECSWRIVGTKGTVLWDGGENFQAETPSGRSGFIRKQKTLEVPMTVPEQSAGGHNGLIADYLQCLEKNTTPETACGDNIKSLAMVHGAIDSATRHRKLKVWGG